MAKDKVAVIERVRSNDPRYTTLTIASECAVQGPELAREVCDALRENTHVTSVRITASLGDDGVATISDVVRTRQALTSIDLTYNQITDKGARAIADALQGNAHLTELDISCNPIGMDGIRALFEAAYSPSLSNIKVNDCIVGLVGDALGSTSAAIKTLATEYGIDPEAVECACNVMKVEDFGLIGVVPPEHVA